MAVLVDPFADDRSDDGVQPGCVAAAGEDTYPHEAILANTVTVGAVSDPSHSGPAPEDLVRMYLRAQNLEQMQRYDEAIPLYEEAVAAGFDAAGPYDRLIGIYIARDAHDEVVRICGAALQNVRTFDDKRAWYEDTRSRAEAAAHERPDRRGAEF